MNDRAKHLSPWVQNYVSNHLELNIGGLTPDFDNKVSIKFEDGSCMFFENAFLIYNKKKHEVAVFTEHCGYYCFKCNALESWGMLTYKPHFIEYDLE